MSQRSKRRRVTVSKTWVSHIYTRVHLTAVGILVCCVWGFGQMFGFGQCNSRLLPEFCCQLLFPAALGCIYLLRSRAGSCKQVCWPAVSWDTWAGLWWARGQQEEAWVSLISALYLHTCQYFLLDVPFVLLYLADLQAWSHFYDSYCHI